MGRAAAVQRLEIFWPATGRRQILENLDGNRCYEIEEDNPQPRLIELKRFTFSRAPRHDHH